MLTFHRCINQGSYWQTRCLVDGLRDRGLDAFVLDHHARHVERAEWRCALRPTLPTPVPRSDHRLYRKKVDKFCNAISTLPMSQRFALDDPAGSPDCDVVVVGSDEVWNLQHPWYGGTPLFFGEGIRARRTVSYAASFGNHEAASGLGAEWTDRLRSFDAISVRDANSRDIVTAALGCEPPTVLDPCLQFPSDADGPWHGPDGPFVALYGHNFSAHFAERVKNWAATRGHPVISIGYRNDWADVQWLDAGPHDFAHAVARSTCVATNFFHGCVFALRHERPFVCEPTPYRGNKIRCLMADVGAERHLVVDDTPPVVYDMCLGESFDSVISRRIDLLRDRSTEYLDAALG